jgi:hypothetical protein
MKCLQTYINEKLHISNYKKEIDPFDYLCDNLYNIILKNQNKITEKSFEDQGEGLYSLYRVPSDPNLAEDFKKVILQYKDFYIIEDKTKTEDVYKITIKDNPDNYMWITYSNHDSKSFGYKKGDVLCIDVSTEIKNELIKLADK